VGAIRASTIGNFAAEFTADRLFEAILHNAKIYSGKIFPIVFQYESWLTDAFANSQ